MRIALTQVLGLIQEIGRNAEQFRSACSQSSKNALC